MVLLVIKIIICLLALVTLEDKIFHLARIPRLALRLSGGGAPFLDSEQDAPGLVELSFRQSNDPAPLLPPLDPPGTEEVLGDCSLTPVSTSPSPGSLVPNAAALGNNLSAIAARVVQLDLDPETETMKIGEEAVWIIAGLSLLFTIVAMRRETLILASRTKATWTSAVSTQPSLCLQASIPSCSRTSRVVVPLPSRKLPQCTSALRPINTRPSFSNNLFCPLPPILQSIYSQLRQLLCGSPLMPHDVSYLLPRSGSPLMPHSASYPLPRNGSPLMPHDASYLLLLYGSPLMPHDASYVLLLHGSPLMLHDASYLLLLHGSPLMPHDASYLLSRYESPLIPLNASCLLPQYESPLMPLDASYLLPLHGSPLMPHDASYLLRHKRSLLMPHDASFRLFLHGSLLMPHNASYLLPQHGSLLMPHNASNLLPHHGSPLMPPNDSNLLPQNGSPLMPDTPSSLLLLHMSPMLTHPASSLLSCSFPSMLPYYFSCLLPHLYSVLLPHRVSPLLHLFFSLVPSQHSRALPSPLFSVLFPYSISPILLTCFTRYLCPSSLPSLPSTRIFQEHPDNGLSCLDVRSNAECLELEID
nr:PREDICTED: uncharacterized protein LOC107078472 isoform X1 [Lepisosteus oculatus]